jgi:hypothetical protein
MRVDQPSRRHTGAHRVSWELSHGKVPVGLYVLHHCDTPCCVNPDHLFLGTDADNRADCVQKGRQARGTTSGNAKLTEQQVREIRAYGRKDYALTAKLYGVSRATARRIAMKLSWSHLR